MSVAAVQPWGIFRTSAKDALLIVLALGHGALLLAVPTAPVVALGLWWNSNTISHYFLHQPFFRIRILNILFRLYLTVLLGIPQTLWKERHLAHHAGRPWQYRRGIPLLVEVGLVLGLWGGLLALAPAFFFKAYVPGYLVGLGLCYLHGTFEHPEQEAVSHHGWLYNVLFLNDGYHVEHHAHPGLHWSLLPRHAALAGVTSRWPAVLRWLEMPILERLERLLFRSARLRRFLLESHERAFRKLLPSDAELRRVAIVGGGLFPRTALVLRALLPNAQLTVIDRSESNLTLARPLLPEGVALINDFYDPVKMNDFDAVVIPLSYLGDRKTLYRNPPAPYVFVHDWIWRRRGTGSVVSFWLLKRLNRVTQCNR